MGKNRLWLVLIPSLGSRAPEKDQATCKNENSEGDLVAPLLDFGERKALPRARGHTWSGAIAAISLSSVDRETAEGLLFQKPQIALTCVLPRYK